jgi:acetyl-CoA C-acetyltransferase
MAEAYIVAATRTAGGRRGGRLREWHPVDLAAKVIDEVVARSGVDPATIDDVIMGCVSQIGQQSANVARNAVLASCLPDSVPATSIDRQCGSSQQALHFAAQAVMSGSMDIVLAGGVESMSRVPMGSPVNLAVQADLGTWKSPGLVANYPQDSSQFNSAEMIAKKYDLSKEVMDAFGYQSHQRAIAATQAGAFKAEILPVIGVDKEGGEVLVDSDEGIRYDANLDSIAGLKLLLEGGRLTAGTSSQMTDGASGILVVSEAGLKTLGVKPLARIHHMSVLGGDPIIKLEAPIPATERALKKAGMSIDDFDLFEVNEAFASIPLAWMQVLGVDPEKVNVNGGAIALGHPLGATGTKLMTTLLGALKARNKRWGLQTMCEGGGLANVTIVERL